MDNYARLRRFGNRASAVQPGAVTDAQRHAGDKYVEVSEVALRRLVRHLEDEEDLIIPLMFEWGE